jgi:hypothetical protein
MANVELCCEGLFILGGCLPVSESTVVINQRSIIQFTQLLTNGSKQSQKPVAARHL